MMAQHRVEVTFDANTQNATQNVNSLIDAISRLFGITRQGATVGGAGGSGGGGGTVSGAGATPSGYGYVQQRLQFYGERALSFGLLMSGYSLKNFANYLDQLNNAVMDGAQKFNAAMTKIFGVTSMTQGQRQSLESKLLSQQSILPASQVVSGVYPFATRNYPMQYAPQIAKGVSVLSFMTGTDAQTIGNLLATALEQSTRNLSYSQRRQDFSKDFKQLLDLLAYSWSKSPIEPSSVLKASTYAMPALLAGGLKPNEAYALFATMLGAVPEGGRVGRYARTALTNMVTLSPAQEAKLQQLTGLSAQQLDWTKGLVKTLQNIADALKNKPETVQLEAAKNIFGLRGMSSGLDLIKNLQELEMYIKEFNPANVKGYFGKMEQKAESTPYGQYVMAQAQLQNALTSLAPEFMKINKGFTQFEINMIHALQATPKWAQDMILYAGKAAGAGGEILQQLASIFLTVAAIKFILNTRGVANTVKSLGAPATWGAMTAGGAAATVGRFAGFGAIIAAAYVGGNIIGNLIVDHMNKASKNGNLLPDERNPLTTQAIQKLANKGDATSELVFYTSQWIDALKTAAKEGKASNDIYYRTDKNNNEYISLLTKSGKSEVFKLSGTDTSTLARAIANEIQSGKLQMNLATLKGDAFMLRKLMEKVTKNTQETAQNTKTLATTKATSELGSMLQSFLSDNKLSFSEITKIQAEMIKERKQDLTISPQQIFPEYQPLKPLPKSLTKETPQQPTPSANQAPAPSIQLNLTANKLDTAADKLEHAGRLLNTSAPAVSINFVGGF